MGSAADADLYKYIFLLLRSIRCHVLMSVTFAPIIMLTSERSSSLRARFEALEDYRPGYVYGSIVSQCILYGIVANFDSLSIGLLLVPSAWSLLLCL